MEMTQAEYIASHCKNCGKYVDATVDSNLVPQSVSKFVVCVGCSVKAWKAVGGDIERYRSIVGRQVSR